jgi:hypothetical protein
VRRRRANGPDLRGRLGIPASAVVFGRYGGKETFDIPHAVSAVLAVASARPDIYFLFMNTAPLHGAGGEVCTLPNVIHLAPSVEDEYKSIFIRSCDAMLHARAAGETFGLAIAEFSAHNRC